MSDTVLELEHETQMFLDSLLVQASLQKAFSVVLTGSMARSTKPTLWTDVDILTIELGTPDTPPSVHLIEMKQTEFVDRLDSGDDFVQWAARFGRPLYGATNWTRLVTKHLPSAPWPDHRKKLLQARRRLEISHELLEVGDVTSAQKELVYAASHLGRAMLFKR